MQILAATVVLSHTKCIHYIQLRTNFLPLVPKVKDAAAGMEIRAAQRYPQVDDVVLQTIPVMREKATAMGKQRQEVATATWGVR